MWQYRNPVRVSFGAGALEGLGALVGGRRYLLVTYPDAPFDALAARIAALLGAPCACVADVAPNPDLADLARQAAALAEARAAGRAPELVLALGGGSVIDSAKVLAAAPDGFEAVAGLLGTGRPPPGWRPLPVIAVPTTAGTGSEVTCWATVWDRAGSAKHSLDHPLLYPEHAVIDPELMRAMPPALTLASGLDALSHALESLWNRHANPVSAALAVAAARTILEVLPQVLKAPGDPELRSRMAEAALQAGLAFSNTRTALAHAISYPVTLRHGVPHGIACAFSLPMILHALADHGGPAGEALRRIFGPDLRAGALALADLLEGLGVGTSPADHGITPQDWAEILATAGDGARGRNFVAPGVVLRPLPPRPGPRSSAQAALA